MMKSVLRILLSSTIIFSGVMAQMMQQQMPQQQMMQQQMMQQQMQPGQQQQMQMQQQQQPGNVFVLPPGSLQPYQDTFSFHVDRPGSGGGGGGVGRAPREETKYGHFKPEHVNNPCPRQRKIVIDVDDAGFGNKLLAVVSTAILATLTNRVLEIQWTNNRNYNDLFNVIPQQPMLEVFRDLNSTSSNTWETVVTECMIKLTPANDYSTFWFLRHPQLFQKLDQTCEIIYIYGSVYYAPFLMDPSVFGDKANLLRNVFTENPFNFISKCHLRPKDHLLAQSQQIIQEMRSSGGKWLSIHARAYYDYSGKASSKAFTCAKKLLEVGAIKKVYFGTESAHLMDLARNYFQAFPGALYVSEKMVQSVPPGGNLTNIDNDLNVDDQHVVEWLTIGEADYCLSPTYETSPFSNTALFRGPCILVPIRAYRDCDIYLANSTGAYQKRLIFGALNNPRAIRTWSKPVDLDKMWNSVE